MRWKHWCLNDATVDQLFEGEERVDSNDMILMTGSASLQDSALPS